VTCSNASGRRCWTPPGSRSAPDILRAIFAALDHPAGVSAHRCGAIERVQPLLADRTHAQQRLADTETRMTAVLDELPRGDATLPKQSRRSETVYTKP
jgi:hypothetical protein